MQAGAATGEVAAGPEPTMNPKLVKERIRTTSQRPDIIVAFENLTRRPRPTTPSRVERREEPSRRSA